MLKFRKFAQILFLVGTIFFILGCETKDEKALNQDKLKFSDLSMAEQDRYISKDELDKLGSYLTLLNNRNIDINSDEIPSGSVDELRDKIAELIQKNRLLFADNEELAKKNLEIITKLREQNSLRESENKLISAKYLDSMNEVEKQHYKNINDLTKKINEVQKENIQSIKSYEQKIIGLENKIDELEKELSKKDINFNEKVSSATKDQLEKNKELSQKNSYLLEQTQVLKKQVDTLSKELDSKLADKKTQIDTLNQTILTKDNKINDLLASHTNEIIELQNKHSKALYDIKNELDRQKNDYFGELNLKNSELAKLNNDFKEYKLKKDEELKNAENRVLINYKKIETQRLNAIKSDYERIIFEQNRTIAAFEGKMINLELKFKKDLEAKDANYVNTLENLKQKALFLKNDEDRLRAEFDKNITSLKSQITLKNIQISELDSKIKELENEKNDIKKIQNYEILNNMITKLNAQNEELKNYAKKALDEAKKMVLEAENKAKEQNDKLKNYYEELIKNIKNQDNQPVLSDINVDSKRFLSEISCLSLDKSAKLDKDCKNKLNDMIKKYGKSRIYEIKAVISDFKFLGDDKVGELKNVNLLNLKSTKDMLNAASKAINSKIKDPMLAYSKDVLLEQSGYGFVIKVYE